MLLFIYEGNIKTGKKYYIYKHTNKINGKVYIGQTYQKPEKRMTKWLNEKWKDPLYKEKCSQNLKDLWQSDKRDILIQNSQNNAINNWKNPNYRKKMCKAVLNIETGLIFESGAAASRWCNIDRSTITKAIKSGKQGGRHPETNQPLHWRYAEEGGEL